MLECVWCKKKMGQEWSKDKEPLCSECARKYHFGVEQGMTKGRVLELTKEQRREISTRLHDFERFWGTMRSVEREVLTGREKIFSRVSAWTLGITALVLSVVLIEWFSGLFMGKIGEVIMSIIGNLMLWGFVFFAIFLHSRVVRFLKFRQLKRKVMGAGYGRI